MWGEWENRRMGEGVSMRNEWIDDYLRQLKFRTSTV